MLLHGLFLIYFVYGTPENKSSSLLIDGLRLENHCWAETGIRNLIVKIPEEVVPSFTRSCKRLV
ncbi:hypothetical protein Y697_03970 [Mesotoga sp. BH458_6_3_2_1]|nr:hypothetical protein Y697_03970 [Mesotoga sp. BH458_6_3_2_1]